MKYDDVDKIYAQERNSLIPQAEAHANMRFGKSPKNLSKKAHEEYTAKWNEAFHSKMNSLWENREGGLL